MDIPVSVVLAAHW